MRCSWAHCQASFEGPLPASWRLVCRQTVTGEHVVVCPEHCLEAARADLRVLSRLSMGLPRLWGLDELEVTRR